MKTARRLFAIGERGSVNRSASRHSAVLRVTDPRSIVAIVTLFAFSSINHAAEWVNISDSVTSQVKPGYAGPTAGVVADPASGDVFMVVNDQGLWKSSDHGATFARCDGTNIGGRCETGYALQMDPDGRRMFCFMIYGSSAMTLDGGKSWMKSKLSHFDFGSVDWDDTAKRVLALRHESGGMLATSDDGGATWKDLEKGFSGCGVFDRKTFVATKAKEKGIFRSTDAGATWTKVSDLNPVAATPVVYRGTGYWCDGTEVLVSKDKGATWSATSGNRDKPYSMIFGPLFGKTAEHFVVVGKAGFLETKDGGKNFTSAAPLPGGFNTGRVGPNYSWDPKHDIFYASTMTKPTFKYQR
jgi:photosystem II stability/assembly factor-like uncharacterized protein